MTYHYTESGLDNVWLENGYVVRTHPNYGEGITITNVRGLHQAIGEWIIAQPRPLFGAEFRFLRIELDLSQRRAGELLGTTEQSVAKWEKARAKHVANKSAERLLRLAYAEYIHGKPEFSVILDRLTQLDAERAERDLHLTRTDALWQPAVAA